MGRNNYNFSASPIAVVDHLSDQQPDQNYTVEIADLMLLEPLLSGLRKGRDNAFVVGLVRLGP